MTNPQMSKEELKQAKKDARKLLKKPFYKKWWVWLLAIIIIGIATSGGEEEAAEAEPTENVAVEETTAPAKEEAPKEEAPKEEAPKEAETAKIGDTIKVGDVEFTVQGRSTADNVGGEYGVDSQGTFLVLDVEVKNVGTESITADSSFFQLKSGEKTYDADGSASIYANEDTNFFLEQVNPDLSLKGKVVFDVSDEVLANKELQVQVSTGFFGTETGLISVAE